MEVEDTGVGMTPEAAAHAFDLFYQEQGTAFKGTGLGLALSKELIELHHGTISLQSEKWKGTSFLMRLPLGNAHLTADEIVKEEQTAARRWVNCWPRSHPAHYLGRLDGDAFLKICTGESGRYAAL